MAKKKASGKGKARGLSWRGRLRLAAAIALLAAVALALGYGLLNASLVRLRRAEVLLPELPEAFEGVTVLYLSDIDLCGINTAQRSAALLNQLQALKPDILLLGGDYTSPSLLERLNRTDPGQSAVDRTAARENFFHYISAFDAPLGRYALASPDDGSIEAFNALLEACGFQAISNAAVPIHRDGQTLWLAGLSADRNISAALTKGYGIQAGDCVILAAYSPACFPMLMTLEAPGGGRLIDLALAGHTHGGQIQLFGRNLLSLTAQEQHYLYGWSREAKAPMLTTSGLGCEGINLRIGTSPEAWLIKLTGEGEQ